MEEATMKIVLDRGYCDASRAFCARCSAAFFRHPLGTDRPCVVAVIDDGQEDLLHFEILTDGRVLEFDLTKELQAGLALEGWEFLADFDPVFFRHGAAEHWRALIDLPNSHSLSSAVD
jgi:hypothetical protein